MCFAFCFVFPSPTNHQTFHKNSKTQNQSAASAEGTTTEEAEGVSEPPIKLVHVLNPGEREYLSPNLIGVQNIAMSFLPLSMNFVNIVDAFREITSGVRYEILLNAVDTKAENADTICRLVILEKPWLRTQWGDKHRELVNSNCTDSAENSLSSDPAEKARLLNEKYVSNSIFNGGQRNELSDSEMAHLEAQILTGMGPMKRKVSLNKSGAAPPAAAPTSASPLAGDPAPAAPALLVTITVSDWKPTPPGPESGPTNEATTAISIDEAAAATEQTPPESVANDGVEAQEEEQQQQQVDGTTTPPATSELNDNEKRWLDDFLSVGAYNFEKTIQKKQNEDSQQQEQQEEAAEEETIQEEATTIIPSSAS
ncbi:blast:Putative cysteine proteinase CG12163 [Drosophila guanche]|uniref:Blast:Putative cysteine proteinase CG12163 n=1 Tax=Drosophila guanche TaxID=7266 RepID=A0A3B0KEA1_DROGU|nr:blast:Putative cysteine proteinase CG12163 [Drosophila guanche]